MPMDNLQQRIQQLRAQPLLLICRTPKGKEQVMTVEECRRTGSTYVHVAVDELDKLLAAELGRTEGKSVSLFPLYFPFG